MDLLIVTMITYGRLSLSGVVGDHPGETTIRKGRSMNIQLMNVAVDIIEQRLAPLANVLTRNNHITAMRDSFALAMPFVIVGSLLVPILFPPAYTTAPASWPGPRHMAYILRRPSANYWPGGADCRLFAPALRPASSTARRNAHAESGCLAFSVVGLLSRDGEYVYLAARDIIALISEHHSAEG
ncbi:PTS sugar transporter subunit IIC [Klebsiella pneumoniae]|nr:PTS sugar transporter subunit IIC [Klebsiella pneumoniae]